LFLLRSKEPESWDYHHNDKNLSLGTLVCGKAWAQTRRNPKSFLIPGLHYTIPAQRNSKEQTKRQVFYYL